MSRSTGRRALRGFTLLEIIVFIVVVGVGLTGILLLSQNAVKSSADPMMRKQALALADSILEEILQKEYADPDGVGGETTRATMDDVQDYHGQTQALFTDWPAALSAYTVTISVSATSLGTVPARRVAVSVTGGGHSVTLAGYRTQALL